ncbi:MAG: tetratricopeptide repeat protein [Acidobacteriota bacterium]|jgi:tetratricopeptide (TPR) repeat protein|nr:tetratricopeptide repeat protein [Acidobacteriota bacterium]
MSKTTRPEEKKATTKTAVKLSPPAKEKPSLKKTATAPVAVAASATSKKRMGVPVQASGKKTVGRTETEVAAKAQSPVASAGDAGNASEEASREASQILRRTKTTGSALTHLEKGIELLYKKDLKKAQAELQSLIDNHPNDIEISVRARSYLDICKREESRQKKTTATADQFYALGVMEHNKANYDKAVTYFRQSLEKHPKADYIYYSIAASLARKGAHAESIETLRKAVTLNEDSRVHAKNDPDFLELGGYGDFQRLVGAGAFASRRSRQSHQSHLGKEN